MSGSFNVYPNGEFIQNSSNDSTDVRTKYWYPKKEIGIFECMSSPAWNETNAQALTCQFVSNLTIQQSWFLSRKHMRSLECMNNSNFNIWVLSMREILVNLDKIKKKFFSLYESRLLQSTEESYWMEHLCDHLIGCELGCFSWTKLRRNNPVGLMLWSQRVSWSVIHQMTTNTTAMTIVSWATSNWGELHMFVSQFLTLSVLGITVTRSNDLNQIHK